METFKRAALSLLCALSAGAAAQAAVNITSSGGWLETCWVKWANDTQYDSYNVYVKGEGISDWRKLDAPLVRNYGDHGRADALGLKAGTYQLKVVPVKSGSEATADAGKTANLEVKAHDRNDYAHFNWKDGIGAYNNDGTLKEGAKVLYVYGGNAGAKSAKMADGNDPNDVHTTVKVGKNTTELYGLQTILAAYEKGTDQTPLDFRIIGTLAKEDLDAIGSKAEGLQVKGKNNTTKMNITIEGVGDDAVIYGFGFLIRNACNVEFRNLALMCFMDDGLSFDTDNSHCWAHNMDFFYGSVGGDSDQAKGDGSVDIKGDSQFMSVSYCHFWDSGKCSLCGMKSESGPNYITYHHNWFDHSDSRHPRIRTMTVHVYNNYFDGCAKYGVGTTMGSDCFVENNYFRNVKYPMLTAGQGTDTSDPSKPSGTFSGENGGMIKAFGNKIEGAKKAVTYSTTVPVEFDYFQATSRNEKVPSGVACKKGGDTYNNFDTDPNKIYSYTPAAADDVEGLVTGEYGAGRCQHGNFSYTFGANEDTNYDVITILKSNVTNYKDGTTDKAFKGFYGNIDFTSEESGNPDSKPGTEEADKPSGGSGSPTESTKPTVTPQKDPTYVTPETTGPLAGWELKFTQKVPTTANANYTIAKGAQAASTTNDNKYGNSENSGGFGLKLETETSVKFTFPQAGVMTIDLGKGKTVNTKPYNIKIDNVVNVADDEGLIVVELSAGPHELTKKDINTLFYANVKFLEVSDEGDTDDAEETVPEGGDGSESTPDTKGDALTPAFGTTGGATQAYTLTGQKASTAMRGLLIERQGGKARLKLNK